MVPAGVPKEFGCAVIEFAVWLLVNGAAAFVLDVDPNTNMPGVAEAVIGFDPLLNVNTGVGLAVVVDTGVDAAEFDEAMAEPKLYVGKEVAEVGVAATVVVVCGWKLNPWKPLLLAPEMAEEVDAVVLFIKAVVDVEPLDDSGKAEDEVEALTVLEPNPALPN